MFEKVNDPCEPGKDGCGGSKETKVVSESTTTTTTGQELQDLKKARDEGAINEQEYEAAKKKILKEE